MRTRGGSSSLVWVSAVIALTLGACGGAEPSLSAAVAAPTGLADDHLVLAIDYLVHDPVLEGVYDPRLVSLTADGTLVVTRRDVDAMLGTTVIKLDAAGFERAWSAVSRSGVFTDGDLELPGFMAEHEPTTADVFRVDDGTRSTRLTIASLGSEGVYPDDPPVPSGEMALRASATKLIDEFREMGGSEPWTPRAVLLWWRTELPADSDATVVGWTPPIDLASAGQAIEHPVWDRCTRLDGDDAASVGRYAQTLPIDHLVELDGVRYAIDLRAIHPDEVDEIACP